MINKCIALKDLLGSFLTGIWDIISRIIFSYSIWENFSPLLKHIIFLLAWTKMWFFLCIIYLREVIPLGTVQPRITWLDKYFESIKEIPNYINNPKRNLMPQLSFLPQFCVSQGFNSTSKLMETLWYQHNLWETAAWRLHHVCPGINWLQSQSLRLGTSTLKMILILSRVSGSFFTLHYPNPRLRAQTPGSSVALPRCNNSKPVGIWRRLIFY